ncbi:hypothetical protein MTP02_03490 [Streptomyces albus]|nr:hypothetical protein MTP02_03490 [Streptomyces albus]
MAAQKCRSGGVRGGVGGALVKGGRPVGAAREEAGSSRRAGSHPHPRPSRSTSRALAANVSAPQALASVRPRVSSPASRAAIPYATRASACSYAHGDDSR